MGRPKKVEMATVYGETVKLEENLETSSHEQETIDELEKFVKHFPEVNIAVEYPKLKVKLVHPSARLPQRANPTDAGADLFATEELLIGAKDSKFMDLGIQLEIPEGMAGFIFARSGLGGKGVRPRNCVGVIDSKYRGNIGMMIENDGDHTYHVSTGDRIAQIVLMPVFCSEIVGVEELDMTDDRNALSPLPSQFRHTFRT